MFGGMRQSGFIPILQSFGASPLELWNSKVQNGSIRRITDEQVRALTLEISGTNVSTCYIYCPKQKRTSLRIHMPFLVMIIKGMKKYFTFEITILDDRNVHRRFHMSNFEKTNRIFHFSTFMPLCLNAGWNEIYFDLDDLTRKAYKTNYVETTRIQIHANCRIRVIYFCDKIYDDTDIPPKFKMFLPNNHECRKKIMQETYNEVTTIAPITELEVDSKIVDEDNKREEQGIQKNNLKFEKGDSTMVDEFIREIGSIESEESNLNDLLEDNEEERIFNEEVENLNEKNKKIDNNKQKIDK